MQEEEENCHERPPTLETDIGKEETLETKIRRAPQVHST